MGPRFGGKGSGMAEYIVYKEGGELKLALHSHYVEETLLVDPRNFVPGKDLVVIPDVLGADEAEARRQADEYFRGEHQDPKRIRCWVAGAVQRQACLRSG